MIDMLVAEPWISQGELAVRFGYTQAWVSVVMSSDAFQARLAQRREELVDPTIAATLEERFRAVTKRSLEVLQEKLSAPASVIPDSLVLKAVELGAKASAIGGFGQQTPLYAPPPPGHLDRLAERLMALQRQVRPELEVTDAVVIEQAPALQRESA